MANLSKFTLGAWAWGNNGTFENSLTTENLKPLLSETGSVRSCKLEGM